MVVCRAISGLMRCFNVYIFACLALLAGCASSPPPVSRTLAEGYTAEVLAVRPVTGGPLTTQITKILGQATYTPLSMGQEVVVKMSDGEVKSFVPPQGTLPAGLVAGDQVMITDEPNLRISIR